MIVSQYSLRPIVGMAEAVSIIMYATISSQRPRATGAAKRVSKALNKPVSTKKRNRAPAALKSMDM